MSHEPPLLRIDTSSPEPVYRQIVQGIRRVLVRGELRPGDRLPTIRELAMDLGVHPNTVAQAYRVLAGEGWLELRRRRGVRVISRPTPDPDPSAEETLRRRVEGLAAQAVAEGIPPARAAEVLVEVAASFREVDHD